MPRRRASRFVFEVLFLVAVAVALTIAELRPVIVGGVMLLGWVVAALFEWAGWLDKPHFGRGLPPRYYVPQVALPPAHPVDQAGPAYPQSEERDDEELTWISSPAAWGEVLEDWPVLDSSSAGDETEIAVSDLPAQPEAEPVESPEADLISELDLSALGKPVAPAEEMPPAEEELEAQAKVEAEPEPVPPAAPGAPPASDESAPAETELEGKSEPGLEAESQLEPEVPAAPPEGPAVPLTARHRIDPLAVPQTRRFRRRRPREDGAVVDVPDRPPAVRALPGGARRED